MTREQRTAEFLSWRPWFAGKVQETVPALLQAIAPKGTVVLVQHWLLAGRTGQQLLMIGRN